MQDVFHCVEAAAPLHGHPSGKPPFDLRLMTVEISIQATPNDVFLIFPFLFVFCHSICCLLMFGMCLCSPVFR
jgi:hypothetical protein